MALRPVFDPKKPTALFVGRYQPFHDGHKTLIVEGLKRIGQVCIAVRNTQGTDEKNPFEFEYVRARIEHGAREHVRARFPRPFHTASAIARVDSVHSAAMAAEAIRIRTRMIGLREMR